MTNVQIARKGNIVTLTVDLSKIGGESKSGKTLVIASTHGNVQAPDDPTIKIGLNVYKQK